MNSVLIIDDLSGTGLGLGLAFVHRIVSEHKGKIHAVANQPNGAS